MKVATVWDNPLMHFVAYGIANPTVVWALEHSLYDEWCPECRATGIRLSRPCPCIEQGDRFCPAGRLCGPEGCPCCRSVCRSCTGTRVRRDRTVCRQDFLDDEAIRVAEALIPGITHRADFDERQLR